MIDDHGTVTIHSWVEIQRGCEVKYDIVGDSGASFTISGKLEPFEIYLDKEVLRALIQCGTTALTDLDAQARRNADMNDQPGQLGSDSLPEPT